MTEKIITPRRGPFSDNYWRDWMIAHIATAIFATLMIVIWQHVIVLVFGGMFALALPLAGLGNYLIDRAAEIHCRKFDEAV